MINVPPASNPNSFATIVEANEYLNLRYSEWATFADDKKAQLLVRSADFIKSNYVIEDDTMAVLKIAQFELAMASLTTPFYAKVTGIKSEQSQLGTMSKAVVYQDGNQADRFPFITSILAQAGIEMATGSGAGKIGVGVVTR